MLADTLSQHKTLLRSATPWALADNLLELFDELTLNKIGLPQDLDAFKQQLANAYGLAEVQLEALSQEATLVHTLWHAWHTQFDANKLVDSQAAYVLALANSLEQLSTEERIYLAGIYTFNAAELAWLNTLLTRQQASLFIHGQAIQFSMDHHPDRIITQFCENLNYSPSTKQAHTPYGQALDTIFAPPSLSMLNRARGFAANYPTSPIKKRLQVLTADGAEQEACAIDVQVRRWLLSGMTSIGIVTENRRLARRVRALLERGGIILQDHSGWALSTTSAAAALESWLQCIEQDFAHLPLLDLIKSGFIFHDMNRDEVRSAAYRLELDVIRHENIPRGLTRYEQHFKDRLERLPNWQPKASQLLLLLLQRLKHAATDLRALYQGGGHGALEYVQDLQSSLQALGMTPELDNDAAGSRLMQVLQTMAQGARRWPLQLSWSEFRAWLGRTLEHFNFHPPDPGSAVQLMDLSQACLQRFDALVIAGVERDQFPGNVLGSPFFNDKVRHELGLVVSTDRLNQRLYHFRCLLESADKILITARNQQDGEIIALSPWLERIQAFHGLAYGEPLEANELAELVNQPNSAIVRGNSLRLPTPQQRPRPQTIPSLLPGSFSPTDYQQLMDCPYQFFAARCLNLSPTEAIRLALSKAEYGERVHQCLQAFHARQPGLPGPFTQSLTENNRGLAIELLQRIATQVFARDLGDNFEHHGWLQQWQAVIPAYIDWQIQRAKHWQVTDVELTQQRHLGKNVDIKGRLDRVDQADHGLAILDYKTGRTPSTADIQTGEQIQLPFYALLNESLGKVQQVEYLKLDKADKVQSVNRLTDPDLMHLSQAIGERLLNLIAQLKDGQAMPAWGDEATCRYCDMQGLCRKTTWHDIQK